RRPPVPSDERRAVRPDPRRAAAAADAWDGKSVHTRIFSAPLRSPGRWGRRDVLAAGGAAGGVRDRADRPGVLRRVRGLLAVERDGLRLDARRYAPRARAGLGGRLHDIVEPSGARAPLARN